MSRKHYEAIASIIRRHNEHDPSPEQLFGDTVLASVAGSLADLFQSDNESFDRSRFFEACGYRLVDGTWSRTAA